jgi:beta-glucosidase
MDRQINRQRHHQNTGPRRVNEVAQLYVSDLAASVVQPIRSLKGFVRLDLQPGESKTAEF